MGTSELISLGAVSCGQQLHRCGRICSLMLPAQHVSALRSSFFFFSSSCHHLSLFTMFDFVFISPSSPLTFHFFLIHYFPIGF